MTYNGTRVDKLTTNNTSTLLENLPVVESEVPPTRTLDTVVFALILMSLRRIVDVSAPMLTTAG